MNKIDGSVIDIIENVVGEFSEDGDLLFIRAYLMDITSKKQAERRILNYQERLEEIVEARTGELKISQEKFRALAENSDDTIMRFDKNFRHLYVNPAVTKQTGIKKENFIGKTHEELGFPIDLCKIWEHSIKKVFKTKIKTRIEFQLPNNLWIDWALIPEFNQKGEVNAVITFGRDITERKRVEQKISEALNKEKELNNLKSLFLSSASHEFKTPLTTILSSVGLLETFRKRGNMEKYSKHIHKIENSVKYLKTMIEEILTLQKQETEQNVFEPEITGLYKLANNIFKEITTTASKEHTCSLNYNLNKEKLFLLDKKLIKLILSNLIDNAIKYSPGGGNIEVNIYQNKKNLVVQISDEGIGILEKEKGMIYTQFHRGVNYDDIPGTGLGLSIVKKSTELHSGSVNYISKKDKGTTFTVTIPITEG